MQPGLFTKPTPDVHQVNQIILISNSVELAILGTLHKHRRRRLDGIKVWLGVRAGLEKRNKEEEEEKKEKEKEEGGEEGEEEEGEGSGNDSTNKNVANSWY